MHPILIVIQARSGSRRLPGKVLADIGGRPMLEFQLRRLLPILDQLPCTIAVATSDLPDDDAVAAVAYGLGVEVVRGSEQDVLGRFALALRCHPAEIVVRLTADCPLNDPAIVAAVVELHIDAAADYTSNVLPRTFPKGLDVEVLSAGALLAADAEAVDAADREHVTPFVYRRPERFRLANLMSGRALGEEWWTVDTEADLERVREIVSQLVDPVATGWQEVLAVVGPRLPDDDLVLVPIDNPEPGSSPWVRRWSVELNRIPQGDLSVAVGDGRVERAVRCPDELRSRAVAFLDRLLAGDQQTR